VDTLPHEKQIREYEETLRRLKAQKGGTGSQLLSRDEITKLEKKLGKLKESVYANLSPSERIAIARHPGRPQTTDYIRGLCDKFVELYGDRVYGDDSAVVGGLGKIGGQKFIIVGHEKGHDTDSRLYRNFGMSHPEGFRKAMRLMNMAAKFQLPVISFIDTPGAFPGLTAEERGQAWAIAQNLRDMMRVPTPIIVIFIGEGSSGGALATAIGDVIGMLEHGYYSVISPEACASILWKDTSKSHQAAKALKLNAEDLHELDIIDTIIKEPLGGAHYDPEACFDTVKDFILNSWKFLKSFDLEYLLERRYQKFRKLGATSESI
jgi:acetyl-CoA carboxylase carboxyl transferase subunit alpha